MDLFSFEKPLMWKRSDRNAFSCLWDPLFDNYGSLFYEHSEFARFLFTCKDTANPHSVKMFSGLFTEGK